MNDGGEEPNSHEQPLESYAAFNRHGETAQAQGDYGSASFFGTTHDPAEEEAYFFAHLDTATARNGKAPRTASRRSSDHVDDPAEEEAYFAHLKTARNGNGLRIQCHPLAIR